MLTIGVCEENYVFGELYAEPGVAAEAAEVTGENINAGGESTFMIDWTVETECGTVDVETDVTLKSSFIRWDYTFGGTAESTTASWSSEVGTEDETTRSNPTPTTAVAFSEDSDERSSAPSANHFSSDDADALAEVGGDKDNIVEYTVDDPSYLTAIAATPDYSFGTGYGIAVELLEELAHEMDEAFGLPLPIVFGYDAPAFETQELKVGKAVHDIAGYAYSPFDIEVDGRQVEYFQSGDIFGAVLTTVPGITFAVKFEEETGLPLVSYSGTPTEAGDFPVVVSFFTQDGDTLTRPLVSIADFKVAAADVVPANNPTTPTTPTKKLAETGPDSSPFLYGAVSLFVLGGLTLVAARRRAEKA